MDVYLEVAATEADRQLEHDQLQLTLSLSVYNISREGAVMSKCAE